MHISAEAQTYATLPNQNLKGERGGWVDNSISNQNPNKFYQANRFGLLGLTLSFVQTLVSKI